MQLAWSNEWRLVRYSPVFLFGGPVALSSVLEPVGHLSGGESRSLSQFPLLAGAGVRVVRVPIPQNRPGFLLEAVASFFSIPNSSGQRKLAPHPVFTNRPQRPPPELLGFHVMSFEPQSLEFGMIVRRKLVALENSVKFLEVASVESHYCLCFEHTLVLVQLLTCG